MTIEISILIEAIEASKETLCTYTRTGGEDTYVNVIDADKLIEELYRIKDMQERHQ